MLPETPVQLSDLKPPETLKESTQEELRSRTIIDTYDYKSKDIPITITVYKKKGEFVPLYDVSISSISRTTEFILEKIRQELIKHVTLGMLDLTDATKSLGVEDKFTQAISLLIEKYFPDADDETKRFLNSYLIGKSLGLGNIDLLMNDARIEEIVINQAGEPLWVYHHTHGWLKTNIFIESEDQIRHYASIIARRVGRQITVLEPLLDAHMNEGDRANATLTPISSHGNTITLRKFSKDPWTITKFLMQDTISYDAAALVWTAIQYELSALIAGGTASGKTSTLNCLANFFPPNQRIISIEDTRELQLPKYLHWVPLSTRLPNAEGKGAISMEDLLVNSLRMRPDRILVGEVRRQREAETLFEAIHTGHSCYATFHANSAEETINRLVHPPINVPEMMLPAISMIIMQFRNRRTGMRRTFQIAEITPDAKANVLMQYDAKKDDLIRKAKSKSLMDTLHLYTSFTPKEMNQQLLDKVKVLKYLVDQKILDVDQVGRIMAEYYTEEESLMKIVRAGKKFQF